MSVNFDIRCYVNEVTRGFSFFFTKKSHIQKKHKKQKKST